VVGGICKLPFLPFGLPPDALDEHFSNPTVVCRVLNYLSKSGADHAGCNPHTDNGWFTLLAAANNFFMSSPSVKQPTHWSRSPVYPVAVPNRGWVGTLEERLGPYAGNSLEDKEAYDWAYDMPAHGSATPFQGPNSWPDLPPNQFREPLEVFRDSLMVVARQMLKMFCSARGLPPDASPHDLVRVSFF